MTLYMILRPPKVQEQTWPALLRPANVDGGSAFFTEESPARLALKQTGGTLVKFDVRVIEEVKRG